MLLQKATKLVPSSDVENEAMYSSDLKVEISGDYYQIPKLEVLVVLIQSGTYKKIRGYVSSIEYY